MNLTVQAKTVVAEMIRDLREEYAIPGNRFHIALEAWIADAALHGVRRQIEIIDVGYDRSHFVRSAHMPYDLAAFATVGDFLEEPNGETTPAYVSGCGLAAETRERDFEHEASSRLDE